MEHSRESSIIKALRLIELFNDGPVVIEMIIEMKKTQPALKVIAISGGSGFSGQIDLLSVAKLLGAKHIIKKPFTVDQIRDAVNDMLET